MWWLRWTVGGYLLALVVLYILPRGQPRDLLKDYIMAWATFWNDVQRGREPDVQSLEKLRKRVKM